MVLSVLGAFLLANAVSVPRGSGSSFGLNLTRSHIALLPSCTAATSRCQTYAGLLQREVERRAPGVRWVIKLPGDQAPRLSQAITLAIQDPPAHIRSPAPEEGFSITSSAAVNLLYLDRRSGLFVRRARLALLRLLRRWPPLTPLPVRPPPGPRCCSSWLGRASTSPASARGGFYSASAACCAP